jgi:hydrogenase expression/formation protein HypC
MALHRRRFPVTPSGAGTKLVKNREGQKNPGPWGGARIVCLAIPGQIIDVVDDANRLAKVDVAGVKRNVNVGLLDSDGNGVGPGDWVLIHVGFAISQVDEEEALATRKLLEQMGADYEQELEELKASVIE